LAGTKWLDATVTLVEEWISSACRLLDSRPAQQYESVHLDRLLGDAFQPARAVATAIACLQRAVESYAPRSDEFMVRLIVPLIESSELAIEPPALNDLQAAANEFEPPSLYLSRRSFALWPSDFEEYRLPLAGYLQADGNHLGLVITYSCYRDPITRERDWGYYRAIWIEHYPPALLLPP
jgi:hypothetical protein